jgi:hypothetical protein
MARAHRRERAGRDKGFPGTGQSIWNNSSRDDGALFDAQGQLVSYWRDGQ